MEELSWASVIFQGVVLGLIVLFFVSFAFFVRRLLLNSTDKNTQLHDIERKLDKIIELLESNKK